MRNDLGVGFGREGVAFRAKLLLKSEIVLNDSVVNDYDFPSAIAMRMSILFAWSPVSGPACVPDAVGSFKGLVADNLFEIPELAFRAANLKTISVPSYSYAGRVVTAVLKFAQSFDDDGNYLLLADVTDDSAH
jgi:hypothetical protein